MKLIAYQRSAGSELALLRGLSHLRRTDSLKRFQERSTALKGNTRTAARSTVVSRRVLSRRVLAPARAEE